MNDTRMLWKSIEWSCTETPRDRACAESQLPWSQSHSESPRTPQAVTISGSSPKHPASPSCLSPNTHLGNPRSVCSRSLPDLSHFAPFLFLTELHTRTPWPFPWQPNIPSQDSTFQNLSLCPQPLVQQIFMGSKRHVYFAVFLLLPHLFPFLQIKAIWVF